MYIYKVTQLVNIDYDTFDEMVVVAPDVETARNIHPYGQAGNLLESSKEEFKNHNTAWCNPDQTVVELIGQPIRSDTRIIMTSFRAG